MKRSEINRAWEQASDFMERCGWALPPEPAWDITDFGLGNFEKHGLALVNLAEEPEYCEKIMYARRGQITPAHTHRVKKEDIICRRGTLCLQLWSDHPNRDGKAFEVQVNGRMQRLDSGSELRIRDGERITLTPGIYHAFWPESEECLIGEVSTANNDVSDNLFASEEVGRFPGIEEDEPARIQLLSES